jgi:glycosyltransferase involved in cell wall biosynthesis
MSIMVKMKSTYPKFSVIIPHYDIPDLLMRCLKSIPVSEDIQVIVVDDNSPDADTYLEKYPELSRPYLEFIRTTKGGGAGYARNVGLDHAKGKWLLFADADDFYVDNMYDIISMHVESDADVIFFKNRAVCSDDVNQLSKRDGNLNRRIESFFVTGDEWPIRMKSYVPWGKMIKKEIVVNNKIRFDEVKYSNDVFFSTCVGYYADIIKVTDTILYVVTSRKGSLRDNFCSKPGELEIRAEVAFKADKFLIRNKFGRERSLKPFLWKMLKQDRRSFKYYFYKLDEIYPSKLKALNDLRKGHSMIYQVMLYIYSFWLWIKH